MNDDKAKIPQDTAEAGQNEYEKGNLKLKFVEVLPYNPEPDKIEELEINIENAGKIRKKGTKTLETIPLKMDLNFDITLPADKAKKEQQGKKETKTLENGLITIEDIPLGNVTIKHKIENVILNNSYDLISMKPTGAFPITKVEGENAKNKYICKAKVESTEKEIVHGVLIQSIIFDSHMHIESGRCAPLPMLWDKSIFIQGKSREEMLAAGTNKWTKWFVKKDKFAITGDKSTDVVCDDFIENDAKQEIYGSFKEFKDRNLMLIAIVMPMDMEFAHILGYYGIKVYQKITDNSGNLSHYWMPEYLNEGDSIVHGEEEAKKDDYINISSIKDAEKYKHTIYDDNGYPHTYIEHLNIYSPLGYDNKDSDKQKFVKTNIKPIGFNIDIDMKTKQSKYEEWEEQKRLTKISIVKNSGKILPMYHFEPRRYEFNTNWKEQLFNKDICVGGKQLYLGFKMYTALGYRPFDSRLKILSGKDNFYKECQNRNIPILNHCTPQGMYTHDKSIYFDYKHPDEIKTQFEQQQDEHEGFFNDDEDGYFEDRFISPYAWEPVLNKYKSLKICLAHLGGNTKKGRDWGKTLFAMISGKKIVITYRTETIAPPEGYPGYPSSVVITEYKLKDASNSYPNLYVDISSSLTGNSFLRGSWKDFFKNTLCATYQKNKLAFDKIKKKILFGTDWYMILGDNVKYDKYCKEAKELLDSIDSEFWLYASFINPMRFFGLNEDRIKEIKDAVINARKKYKVKNDSKQNKKIKDDAKYLIHLYKFYKDRIEA